MPSCGTERQMSMKSKMWNMQIGSLVGLRSFDELNSLESSIGLRAQTLFGNFVMRVANEGVGAGSASTAAWNCHKTRPIIDRHAYRDHHQW